MSGVEKLAEVLAARKSLKEVMEVQEHADANVESDSESDNEAGDEMEQKIPLTQPDPVSSSSVSSDSKKKKKKILKKRAKSQENPQQGDRSELQKSVTRILEAVFGSLQEPKQVTAPVKKRNNYKGPTFAGVSSKICKFPKMPERGTAKHAILVAKFKDVKKAWDEEHPSMAAKRRMKKMTD